MKASPSLLAPLLTMLTCGAAHAQTLAYCSYPGPSGEYVYCTDQEEGRRPARGAWELHVLGALEDYERFTHAETQRTRRGSRGTLDGSASARPTPIVPRDNFRDPDPEIPDHIFRRSTR